MTRSLSSLVTVMQNVSDAQPWVLDPKVTPIPWRQDMYEQVQTRPLTIGMLVDDGVVKVHPPIERVLKELEARLKAAGHEIVQWNCAGHKECIEIMVGVHKQSPLRSSLLQHAAGPLLHSRWR
jgi:Asp-tRNA(Asn)/Glu-tRNA(Gln) amidotransferase A subunit family amidase